MTTPEVLSRTLLDGLAASGERCLEWHEVFAVVPRHRFISELIWIKNDSGTLMPLHRDHQYLCPRRR